MCKIITSSRSNIAIMMILIVLSACQSDNPITNATYANDYRIRHPIALTYAPTTLDLFIDKHNGNLDKRQESDLRQFVNDYRMSGRGPLTVVIPMETIINTSGSKSVINKLNAFGINKEYIKINKYQISNSSIVPPIRLIFTKMQAKVTNKCGNWEQDIGQLQINLPNWQNKPWYNMGCAYQSQFAAQVADPIDLIRPQMETRSDVEKRMHAFEQLRNGEGPSTNWSGGELSVGSGN